MGTRTSLALVRFSPAGDGHLTVAAYVNGKGPFPFLLDTGADETGVYQWFAGSQHLKKGKSEEVVGQTGTSAIPTFRIDRLSIDERELSNIAADGLPDRTDQGKQAGVAGNDLMDGSLVVFDFPRGDVTGGLRFPTRRCSADAQDFRCRDIDRKGPRDPSVPCQGRYPALVSGLVEQCQRCCGSRHRVTGHTSQRAFRQARWDRSGRAGVRDGPSAEWCQRSGPFLQTRTLGKRHYPGQIDWSGKWKGDGPAGLRRLGHRSPAIDDHGNGCARTLSPCL